jgi:hypothetical protein
MRKQPSSSHGYYHITVTARSSRRFLHTNNERAFIISQLQDLLSPRLLLETIPAHKQLASCIDLLAFSITADALHLVVFSIDASVAARFSRYLASKLLEYQCEYAPDRLVNESDTQINLKRLRGPHHALEHSITLHILHPDWEYDRYSSIGFYLHDRRGDWMRLWRLSKLYDNDPSHYRTLLYQRLNITDQNFALTALMSAS